MARVGYLLLAVVMTSGCDTAFTAEMDAATPCLRPGDCASGTVCIHGACVAATPCTSSRQCPDLVCDPTMHACVECITVADCATGDSCESGVCRQSSPTCTVDEDCASLMFVCRVADGVCVQCNRDADCMPGGRCGTNNACVMDVDGALVDGGSDAGSTDAGTDGASGVDAWRAIDAGPRDWESLSAGALVRFAGYSDRTPPTGGSSFYAMATSTTPGFARYTAGAWTALAGIAPDPGSALQYTGAAWIGSALYVLGAGSVYRYDIPSGAWTTPLTTVAPTPMWAQMAHDDLGRVYVVTADDRIAIYDTAANAITYQSFGMGSPPATPRLVWDGSSGLLYVSPNLNNPDLYSFDPSSGASQLLSSPPGTMFFVPTFCGDARGHLFAATNPHGTVVWEYAIATDHWSMLAPLPFDHDAGGACTVTADNYLYLTDGIHLARLPL